MSKKILKNFNLKNKKVDECNKGSKEFNNKLPDNFLRNYNSKELFKKFGKKNNEEIKKLKINIKIAGRIINKRIMGKASFFIIKDLIDSKIQLYITTNLLSQEYYEKNIKKWNLGDIIGVNGYLFKTKTGELSINCEKAILLTKSLRHLPDKFHGLSNKEICYRKRYLDLIINKSSYKNFIIRSKILLEIRTFMKINNFIEVETPILHSIPGGATAKPFVTHHHNLNVNMYLRVSPELYLKRLIIGGFEKIFEINKSFRNEGVSAYHNPEFTMMELYIAYANYKDLIIFTEKLFFNVIKNIFGNRILYCKNQEINFFKPFKKMTMQQAILKYYNKNIQEKDFYNYKKILEVANDLNIKVHNCWSKGHIIAEIFDKKIKEKLIQPTFITAYPIEISPLAKRNKKNPEIADRFELFIGGYEIGNGFSELNDAVDQSKRFNQQIKYNNSYDDCMLYDKDYINALEYGMPPTAGLGIGIDRMTMILTNSNSIRDVVLFPTLKP